MITDSDLKAKIAQSQRMALIGQAQHNETMRQWKAQKQAHFLANLARIPDDPTAQNILLSGAQQQVIATVAVGGLDTPQANVAQCDGGRKRRDKQTNEKVHYQQDRYAAMLIPLLEQLNRREIIECMQNSFREIGARTADQQNGCTATMCVIINRPDSNKKQAIFGWLGDSRAAVFQHGNVTEATWDHHPAHPIEAARIKQVYPQFDPKKQTRLPATRIATKTDGTSIVYETSLAVSKSFGNKDFLGSSHEPCINLVDITDPLGKILIASDGVWDKVDSSDICDKMKDPSLSDAQRANDIRQLAYQRGTYDYLKYRNYVPDNITMLIGELTGVYLLLDGHGADDTCVDEVALGANGKLSLLNLFEQHLQRAVLAKTNSQVEDLPASLCLTPSSSQRQDSTESLASTISFDETSSPPEQLQPDTTTTHPGSKRRFSDDNDIDDNDNTNDEQEPKYKQAKRRNQVISTAEVTQQKRLVRTSSFMDISLWRDNHHQNRALFPHRTLATNRLPDASYTHSAPPGYEFRLWSGSPPPTSASATPSQSPSCSQEAELPPLLSASSKPTRT